METTLETIGDIDHIMAVHTYCHHRVRIHISQSLTQYLLPNTYYDVQGFVRVVRDSKKRYISKKFSLLRYMCKQAIYNLKWYLSFLRYKMMIIIPHRIIMRIE